MESITKDKASQIKFQTNLAVFVMLLLLLTSFIFIPSIFRNLFAFGDLVEQDSIALQKTFIVLLIISGLGLLLRKKLSTSISLILFVIVLLIWLEVFFRIAISLFAGEDTKRSLTFQSNATYSEFQAYEGNPFSHFTGKTGVEMVGSKALKVKGNYNNFGYVGNDFFYYKPSSVIRVACLGESTTADGYPKFLEDYLNAHNQNKSIRFEVYNFGHAFWTTAHSLTAFTLNVLDFSPQYLVIHHGWNEAKIRNFSPEEFRGDYSHRFKVFDPPFVADRYIIRVSGLYRFLKFKFDKSPRWTTLSGSIEKDNFPSKVDFLNSRELRPYRRNISSIMDIARLNDIKVILATIPFSVDSNIPMADSRVNIIQCNAITRELYYNDRMSGKDLALIDLDSLISGKRGDIFQDLGHVNDEGRELKAQYIGNEILRECDSIFISLLKYSDKGFDENGGIRYYKNRMVNDSAWLNNDLIPKAKRLNLPLDSILENDAQYLLQNEKR